MSSHGPRDRSSRHCSAACSAQTSPSPCSGFLSLEERSLLGGGWIRTSELRRGQIYSLLPLTARQPLRDRLPAGAAEWRVLRSPTGFVNCSSGFVSHRGATAPLGTFGGHPEPGRHHRCPCRGSP